MLYEVYNDNIVEPNETLTISISKTSASSDISVTFNTSRANVTITDTCSENIIFSHCLMSGNTECPFFFAAVTIGFVDDFITVNETNLSARLTVKVLKGTLAGGGSALVGFSTDDDTALCMQ